MDLPKAIELIEKSNHVGILLPQDASFDSLASAEVLTRTLEKRGKKIGFVAEVSTEKLPHPQALKKLASLGPLPKEFIISYDAAKSPVAELRYEKQGEEIQIILSPKLMALSKDFVTFREGKFLCDCVVALGVDDIETLDLGKNVDPAFFTETPIINIDFSPQNKQYGEINLTDLTKSSLAEILYELAVAIQGEPLDQESATLLLAAIISQTKGFSSPQTTADTLLAASELMRLGAKNSEAFALIAEEQSPNLIQLLGRAQVRSKFEKDTGLLWSFLTAEDFQKTGRSPDDNSRVLEELENSFPKHRASVLLWQDGQEDKVNATLAGERPMLETIKERAGGEFQSPYLGLSPTFLSFREAEERLRLLLTEVL
mgnify:FL=1